MAKKILDKWGNSYRDTVTGSAGTINFQDWNTGYKLRDGYAFVIHSIEYSFSPATAAILEMIQTGKYMLAGLVTNAGLTTGELISGINGAVIDRMFIFSEEDQVGALANARHLALFTCPIVHDFTNEPSGGRLVAPSALYLVSDASGLGHDLDVHFRINWTLLKISEPEYRELYESNNPDV